MIRNILLLCLLAIQGFSQSTRIDQARKLLESKKYDETIQLLTPVEEGDKEYAAARYFLGRVAFDQKQYDAAAEYFEEASETNTTEAEYFTWLGNTYGTIAQDANVLKQGMLAPKMKNAWERAITLDMKNVDARISLIQYYTKAPGFMGGSFDRAREMANQIIKLSPARGHFELGNIYVTEKNIIGAEKEFTEMVQLDPAYTSALANFYAGQKQYDKAFALLEEELKKNPESFLTMYQIGRASATTGQRLERGEECLRNYLKYTPKPNEPSHAGANMRLAQIVERKGNKAEAKRLFEAALKLDGTLKEAQEGLQRTSK
jgi:tetratricopeptide (TPR) repeat protein